MTKKFILIFVCSSFLNACGSDDAEEREIRSPCVSASTESILQSNAVGKIPCQGTVPRLNRPHLV